MKLTRIVVGAALTAFVAHPALAGVIYVPAINKAPDGIQRSTQVRLSNQDTGTSTMSAKYRFIEQGASGAVLPAGPFPTFWVAPAVAVIKNVPATDLPLGKSGMLEVFPGYPSMVVGARLTYAKTGVYSTAVDFPAISSEEVREADAPIYLQGVQHTAGVLTDLGVFNLGTTAAACTVDVRGANGGELATAVPFTVPPISSRVYTDYFGAGGPLPLTVPENSWLRLKCDKPYWAFGVRHNALTGATNAVLPGVSLDKSDLVQPGTAPPPPPPPGDAIRFSKSGTFLTCSRYNKFWKTSISDGRTAGKTFKRVTLDMDIYHANWDPQKKVHIYLWLQNGSSWSSDLFAYLVAVKGKGMRFSLKYGSQAQVDNGPGGQPGNTYHLRYEWNGQTRTVSYKISQNGNTRVQRSLSLNRNSFGVHGMFAGLGSWPTGDGPEALQYNWRYSNLVVDYYE